LHEIRSTKFLATSSGRRYGALYLVSAHVSGGGWPSPKARMWAFTFEVPDGTRGGLGGRAVTLQDIAEHVVGVRTRCQAAAGELR